MTARGVLEGGSQGAFRADLALRIGRSSLRNDNCDSFWSRDPQAGWWGYSD